MIDLLNLRGVIEIKAQTACFTGHRIIPTEDVPAIEFHLQEVISKAIENGYRFFGAGGALGFDTLAAKSVLTLREKYPDIRLILILPCLYQTRNWRRYDIDQYELIKKEADKVVYTSKEYTRDFMSRRNRHLVDNSSLCICYKTKDTGGTSYTVRYAKQQGLAILNIATISKK